MPQMNNPLTGELLDLSDEDFAAYSAASTDLAKPGPTASGRVTIPNPITGEAMSLTPDEAKLFGGVPEPVAAAAPAPDTDINHPFLRGAGVGTLSLAELAPLAAAGAAHLFQKTPLYHELSWVGDQMQRIEPRYLADAQKAAMAKAGTPEDVMFKYGVDPIERGKANLSPQANEDWTFWKKVEFGAGSFVPTLLSLVATKGASAPEVAPLTSFLLHGTVAGETMGVPATASQAASEVYQGADLGDVTKNAAIDFPINMAMGFIPGALPERWLAKAFPGSAVARGTARAAGGATIGTGLQAGSAYAQGQTPDASDLALGALLGGSVAVLHPMLTHDGLTPEQAQSVAAAAAMAKDSGVEPEMVSAIIGRHRLSLDADAMVSELQTAANASAAQQVTAATSSAEAAAHHANTPMGKAMAAARAAGIPDDMITHTLEAHPDNEILAIRALQGLSTPSEEGEAPKATPQPQETPGASQAKISNKAVESAAPEVTPEAPAAGGPSRLPEAGGLEPVQAAQAAAGETLMKPETAPPGGEDVSHGTITKELLQKQQSMEQLNPGQRAPYPENAGEITPAAPGETGGGAAGHGRPLVGHANWQGIPVNLEFTKGDQVVSTNRYGEKKQKAFSSHYGEIPGTVDKDGDPIDAYMGPDPHAEKVWVVNQSVPKGTEFDEHKVMMGYGSEAEARAAYMAHFEPGWKGLMSMVEMTPAQLKTWMETGDTRVQLKARDGIQIPKPTGKETRVFIGNTGHPARYVLNEAADVVTSHDAEGRANKRFPQELQPRAHDSAGFLQRIAGMSDEFQPEKATEGASAAVGAPVVTRDNTTLSGNTRTIAAREMYRKGKGEAYRQYLADHAAEFGLTAEQVKSLKEPLLNRELTGDHSVEDLKRMGLEANRSEGAVFRPGEQARADAGLLNDADMALYNPSQDGNVLADSNRSFVRAFLSKLPATEQAGFMTADGSPTKQLADRITSAIFHKAYGDERLLGLQAEEADPEVRNIINAMTSAAGAFARARGIQEDLGHLNIVKPLIEAIEVLRTARAKSQAVSDYLRQQGLFGEVQPDTAAMASFLSDNIRSARRLGDGLREAGEFIGRELQREKNANLFGDKPLTQRDLVQRVNDVLKEKYGENASVIESDLFNVPRTGAEPAAPRDSGRQPEPRARAQAATPGGQPAAAEPARTAVETVASLPHGEARAAIDDFKATQQGMSLDDMYQRAVGNQARLVDAAKDIGAADAKFSNPGIKGRERTQQKYENDGYDSPHRLVDIVRGGFTVDSPAAADRVVEQLGKKFPVLDKGWDQSEAGYVDRKLLVRFPDGQVGEVQLWEPNLHRAKTEGGHGLYSEARGAADAKIKQALVDRMKGLYSEAAASAGADWSDVLNEAAARGKASLSQANDLLPPDSATEAALAGTQAEPLNTKAESESPTETSTAGRLSKSTTEAMADESKGSLSTAEPPAESIARKALTEGIPNKLPQYEIYDHQTGQVVGKATTKLGAIRSVDRRDLDYGAVRYGHREIKRAGPVFMRVEGAKVLRSDQGGTPFSGDRPEIYATTRVPEDLLAATDMGVGRVFPSTDRLRTPEDVRGMLGFTKDVGTAGIVVTDDLNRPIAVLHHPPGADLFAVQDAISQLEGAARFWTTENQAPELIDALRDSLGLEHAPGEDVPAADDRQSAMASMGETLPVGVRVEDLKAEVSRVLAKHESGPNMPNVTSVQDVGEIPARLTRDAMAMKADHLLSALYDPVDDRIWTIANGFDSTADVERKLFHESLHMGLRRYLGTGLDPFLKRVAFTYGKAGLQDIANRYGYDLSTERGTRLAAEEKLAQLAETMDKPALWDSFTAFVKQWLNKRGFGFDLNPDELQATVASISRRTLRGDLRSVGSRSDNRVRYSMRPAAMAADIQAISDRIMAVPDEAKTLGQRVRDKLSVLKNRDMTSIKQGLLDGAASLEKMERGLTGGDLLDASQSAYKSYYATKNLSSVMAHIMLKGVPEFRNGSFLPVPGRKGLVDIFRPIVEHREGDMLRQWELYAAANRAKRLILEKNPDGTSRENLFTQPEIDAVMKLGDKYPEFKKALADYQEFNKQLLDLSEDRGVLNPEERAMWERNDYVPFYRAMEDMAQSGGAGKGPGKQRGLSGQRAGIRRLKGGDEKLGSILENIVLNTSHLVDASYKNEAMRRIVDLGDGIALHKVSLAWQPTAVSHSQMINALNEAGLEVKHITPEIEKKWATIFRRVAPMGPNIVSVMKGGKPEYYEVSDPLLYRTITSMGTKSYGTLMNIFRFSKHLLTTSITADPGFMVRNFTRDTLNTLLVSDAKITPVSDAIKNFIAVMKDDPDLLKIMAAGYGGGGYYDTNPKDARKILARIMAEKSGTVANTIVSPKRLWWAYQRVGNASEMANRLTVYKSVVKGGGTTAEGAYQANDLLNFAKSGDYAAMQFVVQTVPFLNARIQGTYKVLQGAKAHPFGFAMKAGALMAASMALAGYNQNNPEYEALPDYDKDTYWHIFAGGQHFRIPKPFEIGAMFATVPERIMRTLQGRDTLREFGQRMVFMFQSTFAFGSTGIPFPQAIEPFIQQYANKSGFTGAPIVPESMQNVDPEAQYTPYTSETMKMLGANMPDAAPDWMRSPVRLQAAFESYTGTLGQYALAVSDKAVHELGGFPVEPAKRYYDYPVVSSFVRDPVMKNTHGLEQLYDMQDRADEAYNTLMKYQKEMNLEAMQKQMTEHGGEIAVHSALDGIEKSVAAMNNQIRLVYMNTSMDAEQKRNQIDQLTLERNAIAEQALQFTANMDEHPF
jgi:hypothetical protein